MTREEGENWLINITADIGKVEHQELLKKAVIDAVKNTAVVVAWDDEADDYDVADIAIKATKRSVIESIEELPFAQPEQKKGRWAYTVTQYPYCSECGWMPEEDEMRNMNYDFCPGCGSDMRKEGEDK